MRTSHERIFACGDCAEKVSFFGGKPTSIKLDSIACTEGRIAGANLFGTRRENTGMIGVWSTCVANLALSCAGLTERMADELGYDCVLGSAKAAGGHPACQGSAEEVTAKLVFERRTGVILGGQLMGGKSVGDMANIVSACILKKMTIDDIATFQLGTHPALTCSPLTYPIVNAAEAAHMNSVA
jgi:pyruvate/2-oxoglutarate dehydrogenase complex dihydrolipoamide dehydrogenase (E3) component